MSTELTQLLIKEISGVDAPANELDGWMVLKARTQHFAKLASMTVEDAYQLLAKSQKKNPVVVAAEMARGSIERVVADHYAAAGHPDPGAASRAYLEGGPDADADPNQRFPNAASEAAVDDAQKAHHSDSQLRENGTGRFRQSVFRRAVSQPKFAGAQFFGR